MSQDIKNAGAHLRKRERKIIKKAQTLQSLSSVEFGKLLIRAKRTRRNANEAIFYA